MKKLLCLLPLLLLATALTIGDVRSQETVTIDASKKGSEISPYIYGQFIEHLGRCIYGGIWAEMLEDRKFYDAPGSQGSPWQVVSRNNDHEDDGETKLVMATDDPFVGVHTPELTRETEGYFGLSQKGIAIKEGTYATGYMWVKCSPEIEGLMIMLSYDNYSLVVGCTIKPSGDYQKIPFVLNTTCPDGTLSVIARGKGTIRIGTVSLMPSDNVMGMRADTLQLLKELDSPVYRWPGGNFVSGYDWNDGVGDRDRRPPRKNPAWKGIEHNDFGLDEFMTFCKLLGTEPYIAVNTGNGEVDNALSELEYANGSTDTPEGKRRAENGNPAPYNVKFWGIGNEMYGDWQIGHMPTEEYAKKNNRFVDAFREFDPNLVLVAVGAVGRWDEVIMRQCADHMDLISEHFYVGDPGNRTLGEHVNNVPNAVKRIADTHRKYRKEFPELEGKDIRIAMDEWNYWYGPHVFGELGTRYFVRDGLGIAAGLHEYFRNSDIYYMANYAQTVNVIGCIKTSKTKAQFETTGLVLKLYREHFGNVPLTVESPKPYDVAVALTEDGKTLTVGIVNPTAQNATLKFPVQGIAVADSGQRFDIVGQDPMDYNDPNSEQKIDIVESKTDTNLAAGVTVAPYSVTLLKIAVVE